MQESHHSCIGQSHMSKIHREISNILQILGHTGSQSKSMMFMYEILFKIWQNHWTMKYRSLRITFTLKSNFRSNWLIIWMFDVYTPNILQDVYGNISGLCNIGHMTYIHFVVKCQAILKNNLKVWCLWMKCCSRYMAKSLNYEIQVTVTYFHFQVKLHVILAYNQKVWRLYIKCSSRY